MPSRSSRNRPAGNSLVPFALSVFGAPIVVLLFWLHSLFTLTPEPLAPPLPQSSPTIVFPWATAPPPAVTVCRDGTVSHSTGRGTCSHHGGIR